MVEPYKNLFPSTVKSLWFPLVLGLAVSLSVVFLLPLQAIMPVYLLDVMEIVETGSVSHRFTPVGYSVLLLPGYLLFGESGIILSQAAVYVAFLVIVHKNLCSLIDNDFFIFSVIIILAFHPYLVLGIVRINANAFTIIFIAFLLPWIINGHAAFNSKGAAVFYGGVLALLVATRPNAILLILLVIYTLREELKCCFYDYIRLRRYLIFLVTVIFFYSFAGYIATGHIFYWPSNGPYNLFAGNNPYTIDFLLTYGNAEESISKGLDYYGIDSSGTDLHTFDKGVYVKHALEFISHSALDTLQTWATKVWVIFAPDFRQADNNFEKIVQVMITAPAIVWSASICLFGTTRASLKSVAVPLLFVFLFLSPFVLTNSDPRLRLPLDMFFIVHSAWLIDQVCRYYRRLTAKNE